jgi:POT family proton-dependent oligopeptide transporter
MLLLAAAPLVAGPDGRAPLWLPIAFHAVSNFGAMCFVPFAGALFTGRAPDRLRGTVYGLYYLSVTVGSLISGPMGGWYDHVSPPLFWTVAAGFAGVGGAILLVIATPLHRWMGPDEAAE